MTLDSLRGLAALTVMIHHYLLTFPSIYPYGQAEAPLIVQLLQFSPLHLLWAGYEAVLLFFVLSGFVLSLPFLNGMAAPYGMFVVKRWARIWLPYISIVTLAGLAHLLFGHMEVGGTSSWFQWAWQTISWEGYFNHLLLIGNLEPFGMQFIPVVWSLHHEMLISLVFPVLLFLCRSLAWPIVLLIGVALNVVGNVYEVNFRPFQFLLMFFVGILLAQHRERLTWLFRSLPRVSHVPILALGLGLYICTWLGWQDNRSAVGNAIMDWGVTAASALAIVVALSSETAHRLLTWRPIEWVGRISYSIYLTHTLVMLTVVHSFGRMLPLWSLLIISVPLTLLVSHYAYIFVEKPAMRLGKRWTQKRSAGIDRPMASPHTH